ncbi:phospholipase effector Tle1 domain-containing protein [Ascidiimonas sp. W6]|uniref:phospholipase effector Tle1 domain-containing protein n=1 Tax=Ascidiimonas meishanensis TaxID=3128903 RepID=UPI0030EE8EC4
MAEEVNLTSTPAGAQETREVLSGVNTTTAPVLVGDSEYNELIPEESHRVQLGIYIDGTYNNRNNTRARQEHEKRESGAEDYDEELANLWVEGQTSGTNYATNVARMEPYYDVNQTQELIINKVYIEGIGTEDFENDDALNGGAMGVGSTGVKAKVYKALEESVELISSLGVEKIGEFRIDVFGFSRGAAAARYLIHEVNKRAGSIKSRHPRNNKITYYEVDHGALGEGLASKQIEVLPNRLKVNFVGLYDTVSSHGAGAITGYQNDVSALFLDAVRRANFTLHLTAGDEHRRNFALTNINSARLIGRGEEYTLPGSHGDLGGAYNPITADELTYSAAEQEYLVSQGWYLESQITHVPRRLRRDKIIARRDNISYEYARIPLTIMTDKAFEKGVPLDGAGLKAVHPIEDPRLTIVKTRIFDWIYNGGPAFSFENVSDREAYKSLRNQFLHFSAQNWHPVNFPNKTLFTRRRVRKIIDG